MNNEENFRKFLLNVSQTTHRPTELEREELTRKLREVLVAVGSATPDNLQAAECLEIDIYQSPGASHPSLGVCLKDQGISVSDLLFKLESMPMPKRLGVAYPNLTQESYEAAFRFAVLMLSAFEATVKRL